MCEIMEKSNRECRKQKAYEIAMNLIKRGIFSYEIIAEDTDLTMEEVQDLAEIVKNTD